MAGVNPGAVMRRTYALRPEGQAAPGGIAKLACFFNSHLMMRYAGEACLR